MSDVKINNWFRCAAGGHLVGMVDNHPNPAVGRSGKLSMTSPVVKEGDGWVVTASGTKYILGDPFDGKLEQ